MCAALTPALHMPHRFEWHHMFWGSKGLGVVPSIEDSTSQDSDSSDDGEGVDVSTIVFSSFAYEDVYQVRHPIAPRLP